MYFAFVVIFLVKSGMAKKKAIYVGEISVWLGSMNCNIVCSLVYLSLNISFRIKNKNKLGCLSGSETTFTL